MSIELIQIDYNEFIVKLTSRTKCALMKEIKSY